MTDSWNVDEEKVPQKMRPIYEEVTRLTDAFCKAHLTDEYALMCRKLAAALCRKRPSPVVQGRPQTWACAIAYTVGAVNFLFDKTQTPHMTASELCKKGGVGQSTVSARSTQIRNALKMIQLDPRWTLPSKLEENPLVWMSSVDGLIVDVRYAPREIQEEALRRGLIPYLPSSQ
jgi:hypothetical protein